MKAQAQACPPELCRAGKKKPVTIRELYGLSLGSLPRALAQAFADPLLTPQPEPPRPPVWQARGIRIRLFG
jgi:hypothetical protein